MPFKSVLQLTSQRFWTLNVIPKYFYYLSLPFFFFLNTDGNILLSPSLPLCHPLVRLVSLGHTLPDLYLCTCIHRTSKPMGSHYMGCSCTWSFSLPLSVLKTVTRCHIGLCFILRTRELAVCLCYNLLKTFQ